MTSLIFGTIYLAHQGVTNHRREKQRVKNYERWEGLRDDYDAQRRISRESRSLDIQRTGSNPWENAESTPSNTGGFTNGYGYGENDRPILTLRDQQEANDARTSWTPQERWDREHSQQQQQQQQIPPTPSPAIDNNPIQRQPTAISAQKTGATWDEGLPAPLRVTRQNFDAYDHRATLQAPRTSSVPARQAQTEQRRSSGEYTRQSSTNNAARRQSTLRESTSPPQQQSIVREVQEYTLPNPFQTSSSLQKQPVLFDVEPVESHVPGGRMAELIERGY